MGLVLNIPSLPLRHKIPLTRCTFPYNFFHFPTLYIDCICNKPVTHALIHLIYNEVVRGGKDSRRGLRGPVPCGTFSFGGKGTKRPPGERPRSPRHRPPGDTPFLILFTLCCSWADSTDGAYPSSAAAYRLPTGPNALPAVAHRRGALLEPVFIAEG